ncbi:MAG: peptide chain release factor N(5)-glutamine methyltransferase [Desulfotomaculaceae bacterium]|nr:peptide chain release factor N(5)-glutamine methyltransferase [Desulfotomaculaceae bacterium]
MSAMIKEAINLARRQLIESGSASPALDAEVLLAHVTGHDRAGLYRDWEKILTPGEEARFKMMVDKRRDGMPVAYLTGYKEFMGLSFAVNHFVLIPRPETELMVELALQLAPPGAVVVDAGTGSGAIAVSLAYFRPDVRIYATEQSREAIETARSNAIRHGLENRVKFYQGDLLAPLSGLNLAGRADLLTANLPYIATGDLPSLPREVRLFEPVSALDGGTDGLDLYRRLIPGAATILRPGGILLAEIGSDQREAVAKLLQPTLWEVTVQKDLAGRDRLVVAHRKHA